MKREKFTFYGSWWDAVGCLSGELRGEVLTAIIEYGLYGETNSARGSVTKAILELVKPQIDRDRTLYENGCQGGRPKNQTETNPEPRENQGKTKGKPKPNQTETNPEPDETKAEPCSSCARDNSLYISCVDVNNNITPEKEKEESKEIGGAGGKGKKTPRRFVKPSVEEVQAYCDERDNGVDARSFVDFYESKGWMVGKNPMKDWKAAVRTWEQRDDFRVSRQPSGRQKPTLADIYAENDRQLQETLRKIQERYGTE